MTSSARPARNTVSRGLMAALNEGGTRDAAHVKKMMDDLLWHTEQAMYQSQLGWVAAARKALDRNHTTFAVLNLPEVLSPDGHLAKLRDLGYVIEEPTEMCQATLPLQAWATMPPFRRARSTAVSAGDS
jgi:hypothetical protein